MCLEIYLLDNFTNLAESKTFVPVTEVEPEILLAGKVGFSYFPVAPPVPVPGNRIRHFQQLYTVLK